MNMGGSIVDNLHGWITCGQCPRVGHMWTIIHGWSTCERKGFPWISLINQKPLYKVIWWTCRFMWRTWVQNHIITHIIHMSPCDHMVFVRDYHVVTWFFMCFTCAIHETINLQFSSTWFPPVINMWPLVSSCALHVLCMWRNICNLRPHCFRP